jgi:hypothetical protein
MKVDGNGQVLAQTLLSVQNEQENRKTKWDGPVYVSENIYFDPSRWISILEIEFMIIFLFSTMEIIITCVLNDLYYLHASLINYNILNLYSFCFSLNHSISVAYNEI